MYKERKKRQEAEKDGKTDRKREKGKSRERMEL